ncbi:hypothetical protein ACTXT7_010901 [Hymenolepis weldensis]
MAESEPSNGLNALHLASKEGHLPVVRLLLDHHASIDAKTNRGNTALHIASLAGRFEIIKLLVERKADINARSQNGFTPLYMAAQENHLNIVEYLLNNGADQALATDDGFTPLAVALQLCHDGVVSLLLERDSGGKGRLPALHVAAKKDDVHAVSLLLSNNDVNVNHVSARGFTPLHIAARYGNVKVARFLISNGADVNYCAKDSITPLHLAAKWGKGEMTQLLIDKGAQLDARTRDGLTPMHTAARSGHMNIVQILLNAGASITAKTRNGLSPLHMAAQSDHADTAKLLLKKGSPPDDVTMFPGNRKDYLTPLHIASHCGNIKVAQILLEHKCDPNLRAFSRSSEDFFITIVKRLLMGTGSFAAVNEVRSRGFGACWCTSSEQSGQPHWFVWINGFTPLHIACKKMKVKIAEILLKKGANVDATTQAGLTPLHAAAFVGCAEAVNMLLQRGANVNRVTMRGETPLHFAVRGRHIDTIKILLKHSASVNAKAKLAIHITGFALMNIDLIISDLADVHADYLQKPSCSFDREQATPFHVALRLKDPEIVKMLIDAGADVTTEARGKHQPIHLAAKAGDTDIIKLLLNKGAQADAKTKRGYTALHIATKYGKIDATKYLLDEAKVDVNATARNGLTPLHVAVYYENPEAVEVLLLHGADVAARCKNGFTPLHLAAKMRTPEIVNLLLKTNAPPDAVSQNGYSALHLAALEGDIGIIKSLVEDYSAQVNLCANDGLTPLHLAAQAGRVDVAEYLLAHEADQRKQTKNGYTPLHEAAYRGSLPLVKLLLSKSGKEVAINSRTIMGFTPLHLAAQQGHAQIVDLLLSAGADPNSRTMVAWIRLIVVVSYNRHKNRLTYFDHELRSSDSRNSSGHVIKKEQGWTAAQMARRQHYPNIFDNLSRVTTSVSDWDSPSLEGASADGLSQGDPALVDGSMVLDSPAQMLDRVAVVESEDEIAALATLVSWVDNPHLVLVHLTRCDQFVSTPVVMRPHRHERRKGSVDELSLFKSPSYNLLCEQMEYTRAHKVPIEDTKLPSTSPSRANWLKRPGSLISDTSEPKIRISALDSTVEEQTRDSELMGTSTISMRKSEVEMSVATPLDSSEWETTEAEAIQAICKPVKAGFLVSFLVDARGGFVEAQRRPELRFMIPPNAISSPTRIICRLLRPDRVSRLPHLNDGDAFACRIIEMSPSNMRFDGPILLEVPHFASIQGRDREVITLRCDHGDSWKSHPLEATDQSVQDALGAAFGQIEPLSSVRERRIQRILTADIPRFFALISRFRQEIALIGPDGGVLASTVAPKVQSVFPKGALQKRIKVGLQAQVIPQYVVNKVVGNRAAFSPIVTLEPRRRKFHKPITVTVPLPRPPPKGTHKSDPLPPSLHLLCSITAGCALATWEDITGSTTLTRHKDCISFTTTVSSRLWLVDAQGIEDVAGMASKVYQESIIPPYIGKFAVYARLPEDRKIIEENEAKAAAQISSPSEAVSSANSRFRRKVFHPADAELRCVCLIDDVPEKTLEHQEKFQLVAVGAPTEVMDSKSYWLETTGDIASYPAHANQLNLVVQAFQENRLTYPVRVRQPAGSLKSPVGQFCVFREPRESATTDNQPVTELEIRMPGGDGQWPESVSPIHESARAAQPKIAVKAIVSKTGARWPDLARELGLSPEDIDMIAREPLPDNISAAEADHERCEHMLYLWTQRSAAAGTNSPADLTARMSDALQKSNIDVDGAVKPVFTRVHHIDEEMTSAKTPSEVHPIRLISAITKQQQPPPVPIEHIITAAPAVEVAAETVINGRVSESPSESVKSESPPATAMDGKPRMVPGEEVPYIMSSSIKSSSLERPPSIAIPMEHDESGQISPQQRTKDDMALLNDEIRPVVDDFVVVSENLKRKNLLPPEGAVAHADSVARQIAAEELAEALGLDSDMHTVSVISKSSADHGEPSITEDLIEPIQSEPREEYSPFIARARAETAGVKPTEELRVEAEMQLDDDLRIPSIEQIDNADEDFEEAYHRAAAAEGSPSPTGLAGHDVHQGRPEEGFLVEETEETLPDGTIVKQRVQTSETIQALSAHDWEEAVYNAAAEDNDQYIVEPPEEIVKVEEVEETLPDGTVVKKRITTQHITERITEREVTDEFSENELHPDVTNGGMVECEYLLSLKF